MQPFKHQNRAEVPSQSEMRAYEFVAGTMVQTTSGPVAVEDLIAGECVKVQRGVQPLTLVTSRQIAVCHVVRVEDSTVGPHRPTRDVLLAPTQAVLMRDWRAMSAAGQERALISAHDLVDGSFIRHETLAGQRVYGLRFEEPVILTIEGLDVSVPASTSEDLRLRT